MVMCAPKGKQNNAHSPALSQQKSRAAGEECCHAAGAECTKPLTEANADNQRRTECERLPENTAVLNS